VKRLSSYILTGGTGREQAFLTRIQPDARGAIDTLGAAHLSYFGSEVMPTWRGVYQMFAELGVPVGEHRYACPQTPCPIQEADPDGRYDLMATIIHLNEGVS
jgi:hypothetical protein